MTRQADPGATPTAARALAPDLARGGMLLLIALANAHVLLHGRPLGVRGYPAELDRVSAVVAAAQLVLVDGRAYPLFAVLVGYGVIQLARRRSDAGAEPRAVTSLVRRRGGALLLIGLVHGLLLFPGDIIGAYGLTTVLLAGVLVVGTTVSLLTTAVVGTAVGTFVAFGSAAADGRGTSVLFSSGVRDPLTALVNHAIEWGLIGVLSQTLSVFGAVAFGAWAARRRILDEPERHRALLARVAAGGLATAVLGGLPLALAAAGLWTMGPAVGGLVHALHALTGYAGGLGYAALFGLLATRARSTGGGPLGACGRRSLSCYLGQSVVFAALLPAWTLDLGARLTVWQVSVLAVGTWLLILVLAVVAERYGERGPAERLLRRLTYG
jgi:uncharacterized membrane protein YeiB